MVASAVDDAATASSIPVVSTPPNVARELALEAYGVHVVIGVSDPDLFTRVGSLIPPGAVPSSSDESAERFALMTDPGGLYRVTQGTGEAVACEDLEYSLDLLDALVREHIAMHSNSRTFVQGAAAVYQGRAILVLGPPVSGRSTLIEELEFAGARRLSDMYAVLDENGRLHPYGEPAQPADDQGHGPTDGLGPVALGTVVVTEYRPGARWQPTQGTGGDAVLALLSHAVAARERPAETLAAARAATAAVTMLTGERGDAAETASALLAAV